MSDAPRSTRDRPAKAPLSERTVLDAALALLQAEGLDAVTMRRIAAALDTGPASLYVYVSGRDALLAAMLDRVLAAVPIEAPDAARWREQLHGLLAAVRQALGAHPGIAAATLADPVPTEHVLQVSEQMLALLVVGGIPAQDAAWASDVLFLLVTGSTIEQDELRSRGRDRDRRDRAAELRGTFAELPADRFPILAAHGAEMTAGTADERLRFAIDVVLDGVLARAPRTPDRHPNPGDSGGISRSAP